MVSLPNQVPGGSHGSTSSPLCEIDETLDWDEKFILSLPKEVPGGSLTFAKATVSKLIY